MKATVRFLVTALVLMFVALPLTASAATLNGQGQSTIADVQAKYAEGMTTPDVYSLEVSWGAMEFTCTRTGRNEWNPAEHKYTENTTYVWTANGNTVTVKNLEVVRVDAEQNLILVKGAVPGGKNGIVRVRMA